MNLGLNQKVALVCASSHGIGKAIAQGLALEGAHVSIFSRRQADIEAAAREISAEAKGKVIFNTCDLARREEIERVVRDTQNKLGPIDILVNNHGGPAPGTFEEVTDEQLNSALEVCLRSVLTATRLCLPSMKEKKFGRILNVLSTSAKEPMPGMILSNMLRPAVLGFAKTLSQEYAPYGITVNSVLPSAVLTNRTRQLFDRTSKQTGKDFETLVKEAGKNIPVGYISTADEFAQLSVFLCSTAASYITGTTIAVDGGSTRGLY